VRIYSTELDTCLCAVVLASTVFLSVASNNFVGVATSEAARGRYYVRPTNHHDRVLPHTSETGNRNFTGANIHLTCQRVNHTIRIVLQAVTNTNHYKELQKRLRLAGAPPLGGSLKLCRKCGLWKPRKKAFYKTKVGTYRSPCKKCWRNKYRKPSRQKLKAYKYGITVKQLARLESIKKCQICGNSLVLDVPRKKHRWKEAHKTAAFIDHDHRTGFVRGVLCNKCNLGLGLLGDTISSIRRVVRYLENAVVKYKQL